MGDNDPEENATHGEAVAQHEDAARTTTESGAAAAAGLGSKPSQTEVQTSTDPSARKVNAGSSDR